MTKPRIISAKTPDDLLAAVPFLLGFHPDQSVVLLTLESEASPFHARFDLPVAVHDLVERIDDVAGVAARQRVRKAAVLLYTADRALAARAHRVLADALARVGVEVTVSLRADGARWWCLAGCAGSCCPAEGTPYDVSVHPLTVERVVDGRVTFASRRALEESLVGTDPAEAEAVERAATQVRACTGATADSSRAQLVCEGRWVADRIGRFLRDGLRLDTAEAGRMLAALEEIEVRDAAWAEITHQNAARHVELWRDLVRRAPHHLLAAPAALLGFAAWISGDGALAWCAVDRCQSADPGYRMAALLAHALAGAIPPSSWHPFDKETLPLFAG